MKKNLIRIIVIELSVLFLSACGYINTEIYRNKTTSLYNQGKKFYKSGEYKKAEEVFRDLVDTDSNHFEGNFALGSSLYMQGNYKEAADYLEAASELDSEHDET
ncbi:MAG: tetratricopeptide repeat protein, partial [Acidobacteria bacterium]|nr:tetratricopeptide repeat protein [Acidobacteriota bacterium]